MKFLVFASGRGSNFNALLDASNKGEIKATICGLICDKNCPAEDIAKKASIPVSIIRPKDFPSSSEHVKELLNTVTEYAPDYILLAGYMRIIPTELIQEYPLRIINIHPSLLPKFQGKDAILQAWNAKEKVSGVTVHYVNDRLDQGAIIAQQSLSIPGDIHEFEEQIHKIEHKLYVQVVKSLAEEPFDTLVVSRCLLGDNCRYDGGNKYSSRVEKLVNSFSGKILKVCPEFDCGLGAPRSASDIVDGRFMTKEGKDLTSVLKSFSEAFVQKELLSSKKVLAIFKEKSPSCGVNKVKGIFSSVVVEKLKDKAFVITEEAL